MIPHSRALLASVCAAVAVSSTPLAVQAQCPSPGPLEPHGARGYDGDEPDDFTHYVDADADGVCDFSGDANGNGVCDDPGCEAVVAWDAAAGVHPNGVYPDCALALYEVGARRAAYILQAGHGHWEYTHLQSDPGGASEEKDYLAVSLAMRADLAIGDDSGTATREALEQTLRFLTGEPERFERFLLSNPSGRYWQVDEWIGPGVAGPGLPGPLPLLTWRERFFACGDERGIRDCAVVDGVVSYGGYWSDHSEQLGLAEECGDGLLDDPAPELDAPADPDGRVAACGILFTECESP